MHRKLAVLLLVAALLVPGLAGAVTAKDFEAKTTRELLNLCTASSNDPLYQSAVNFCHGFLVGAYRYYQASDAGLEGYRLVCLPDPAPTRNAAIAMFIDWVQAHPQYMDEKPVETEFRFLMEKWPCKK